MKFTKNQILAIASSLPDEFEAPDSWPTPEGTPGQWARVMSLDTNNRNSANPSIRWNMEQAIDVPGFSPQYRPDWAIETDASQLYADAELAAWAYLNQISSYVLAATHWQRRLGAIAVVEPSPDPVQGVTDEQVP